jgi:hypothetical protein
MKEWWMTLKGLCEVEPEVMDISDPSVQNESITSLPTVLFRKDDITLGKLHGPQSKTEVQKHIRSIFTMGAPA